MRLKRLAALAFLALNGTSTAWAQAGRVAVVAAENVYGDIAEQLGGEAVKVSSLISNPSQDPHLFEASPATARALSTAQIVIANGADYDAWLDKLLQASPRAGRNLISVAELLGRKAGGNPHLWYDPAAMPALANALAAALQKADPAHAADYKSRLDRLLAALKPIEQRVAAMRAKYKGEPVTATEPVFGPMLDAVGLISRNQRFQLAMMNDTEPSAQDLAAFETDLKQHKVKVLINNTQVSEVVSQRLVAIAKAADIPVVGVTETLPPGKHFQDWVLAELDALDKALGGAK
jgi:zinc/manganese transport system substrate-binding protein